MKKKLRKKFKKPDWEEIMFLTNEHYERLSAAGYRNLIDNVHEGCYVESESTNQFGNVTDVIRNRFGFPVCLEVYVEQLKTTDYIPVDRISKWVSADFIFPDAMYARGDDEAYADDFDENFEEYFGDGNGYEEDEREGDDAI